MSSALQQAALGIRLNNYATLVMLTAIGYDYILTFPSEVEYIWKRPWTWVSTLFILVRYVGLCSITIFSILGSSFLPGPAQTYVFTHPLASHIDERGFQYLITFKKLHLKGNVLDIIGAWTTLIFIGAADLVMILRVWALYRRLRFVLGGLLMVYAMEVVPYLIVCIMSSTERNLEITTQVLDYTYCAAQFGTPIWGEIIDAVQLSLGGLMCLLLAIQFLRDSFRMYKATKQLQPSRYLVLFMKEGMFYFLAILTYSVINVVNFVAVIPSDQGWIVLLLAVEFIPAYTIAPRLILSLRELYARDARGRHGGDIDTAFGLASVVGDSIAVSTMEFVAAGRNEDEGEGEGGEEIQMEARIIHSASSDV